MRNSVELNDFDMNLVAYIIRKKREERGLKQGDLADKTISKSVVSNIERQENNFSERALFHLLEKLGILKKDLPKVIHDVKREIEDIQFILDFIATLVDKGDIEEAYEILKQIKIEDFHPLAPYKYFLKARYFFRHKNLGKKRWEKAEKHFKDALDIFDQYKIRPHDNIISMCYNGLSRCCFHNNNLEGAISYVDKGLNALNEELEGNDIRYPLLSNKIYYLLISSRLLQAYSLLMEVWPKVPEIDHVQVVLDLYKFRAIILRKSRNYSEAIQCCKEGIRVGYKKNSLTRTMDLLLVLGSIYLRKKEFNKAKQYFQMAIALDKDCDFRRRHMDAYVYLGILHTKLENWSEANEYLEKAIEIGREINDVFSLTKALIAKGNYYIDQSQYKKATPYYQEAADLVQAHDYNKLQSVVLFKLAKTFVNLNMEKEFSEMTQKMYFLQNDENEIESEDDIYELF